MSSKFYFRYIPPTTNQSGDGGNSAISDNASHRKGKKKAQSHGKPSDSRTKSTEGRKDSVSRKSRKRLNRFLSSEEHEENKNYNDIQHDDKAVRTSGVFDQCEGYPEGNVSATEPSQRQSSLGRLPNEAEKPKKSKERLSLKSEIALASTGPSDTVEPENIHFRYKKPKQIAAELVKNYDRSRGDDSGNDNKNEAEPIFHGLEPIPQPESASNENVGLGFSALPDWLLKPTIIFSNIRVPFENFSLHANMCKVLKNKGYQDALAIQSAMLPLLLPGSDQHQGDLCISAYTGSGKTLGYALPMIESLRGKSTTKLRGLVVVPTRELVAQAYKVLELCATGSGLKMGTAVGNTSLKEEQDNFLEKGQIYDPIEFQKIYDRQAVEDEELMNWDFDGSFKQKPIEDYPPGYVLEYHSKIDILVSTPGRLVDHMKSTEGFDLNNVQWLIIDEADRLLEDSFQQWIETVVPALEYQRPRDFLEHQMLRTFHLLDERIVKKVVLSATMTRDLGKLQGLNLRRPKLVVLQNTATDMVQAKGISDGRQMTDDEQKAQLPPTLLEYAVQIKDEENKPLYLLEMLRNREYSLATQQNCEKADMPNQAADMEIESNSSSEMLATTSSPMSASSNRSSILSRNNEDLPPPRHDEDRTLVFTSSSSSAHRLSRLLQLLDADIGSRITTLTKASSSSTGKLLRSLTIKSAATARSQIVIISTDRASRGLDIPNLTEVINYDIPTSINNYVHRVGRTARAGRHGKATTLIGWAEGRWFWNEIAKGYKVGRSKGMKVQRIKLRSEGWNESEREEYAEALRSLGRETRLENVSKGDKGDNT
ncbi:MAG: hypothetical protein LQ342_003736 [Letrouitia transgressa]|nr:MAG: hypothetical protein LQ342_003736 [Letrouitia transgressa]